MKPKNSQDSSKEIIEFTDLTLMYRNCKVIIFYPFILATIKSGKAISCKFWCWYFL